MAIENIELNHWDLPGNYNENKIVLMVKDPYWIFAYWEISEQSSNNIQAFIRQTSDHNVNITLKVSELSPYKNMDKSFFINVGGALSSWYINVDSPDKMYMCEIGYRIKDDYFISIARSNTVCTPRDRTSGNLHVRYINVNQLGTDRQFNADKHPHLYSTGSEAYFGVSSPELFKR